MIYLYAALMLVGLIFSLFFFTVGMFGLYEHLKKYPRGRKVFATFWKLVGILFIGVTLGSIYLNLVNLFR
jgi:hypothetical protein